MKAVITKIGTVENDEPNGWSFHYPAGNYEFASDSQGAILTSWGGYTLDELKAIAEKEKVVSQI